MVSFNSKGRKFGAGIICGFLSLTFAAASFALPEPLPDPFHAEPNPADVMRFNVDSASTAGTTVTLPQGSYTFISTGSYRYSDGGTFYIADTECSIGLMPGTNTPDVTVWQRNRYATTAPTADLLDLYVDNKAVEWTSTNNSSAGTPLGATTNRTGEPECDQRQDHTKHQFTYSMHWGGGSLRFHIFDDVKGNSGSLSVLVRRNGQRVKEELVGIVTVPGNLQSGIQGPEMIVGQAYRLEATGMYSFTGGKGTEADAECSKLKDKPWYLNQFYNVDADDLLDLHVDDGLYPAQPSGVYEEGKPRSDVSQPRRSAVDWTPASPDAQGCATDSSRTYSYTYVARNPHQATRDTTRLNFFLYDRGYLDNSGVLTVKIFMLIGVSIPPSTDPGQLTKGFVEQISGAAGSKVPPPPSVVPEAAKSPELECVRDATGSCIVISVPSSDPAGRNTPAVPAGNYVIEASGTYSYEAGFFADAECSTGPIEPFTGRTNEPTWQRNRFPYARTPSVEGTSPRVEDPLDLYAHNFNLEWSPKDGPSPASCIDSDPSQGLHVYRANFTWSPASAAAINFRIMDPGDYSRNSGSLTVKLLKQPSGPADGASPMVMMPLNSADPAGIMTPPLVAGQSYRIEITGSYTYYRFDGGGFNADAECTTTHGDTTWSASRYADANGNDPADVYVDDLTENSINNGPIVWSPKFPLGACANDSDRTYTYSFTATDSGPVNLKVFEGQLDWYTDNIGFLIVKLFLGS